jgi:RluA family pseudouridine synthase
MKYPNFKDLILFENEDYFVINKPPFLATLEDRTPNSTNILRLAKAYDPEAQVGHRLDKETSGALAIARNPEAYRHLAIQFEKREVTKVYHAVVWGLHQFHELLVDKPLASSAKGVAKISREGKDAQTYFETIQTYRQHSLIDCRPVTGRLHQIRVHLASLGAPIVSDGLYGGEELYLSSLKRKFKLKNETEEQPLIKRFALHAAELQFALLNGEPLKVTAPYPKDMAVLVKQLEQNL